MVRRRVLFSGRVQGVGFRYTGCRLARDFKVAGYVKNLPDGRVEAVIEGEPAELDRFVRAIEERMRPLIENVVSEECQAAGEYAGFDVRF